MAFLKSSYVCLIFFGNPSHLLSYSTILVLTIASAMHTLPQLLYKSLIVSIRRMLSKASFLFFFILAMIYISCVMFRVIPSSPTIPR